MSDQEDGEVLLQHVCDADVLVHVHVRGVVDSAGLQTQGDSGGVVGVDGEILQIR